MHYKFVYENNRGQRINLSEHPYYLDIEPLLDYQWSYSQKEKRRGNIIAGFAKDIQSMDLTLNILARETSRRDEAIDAFNNLIEADIYDGIAGKIWLNDWYTRGYIISAQNTKWQYGKPIVQKKVKLVREQENWYHSVRVGNFGNTEQEEAFNFVEDEVKTFERYEGDGVSLLEGYNYEFDYMADIQSQQRISNPNSTPCEFIISIQGYVNRPVVQIGENVIAVDVEVPYGANLQVDSSAKTAILTLADGTMINVFGARDPDYYLFARIPSGNNIVTWNGSFMWEVKMLEERSEPRWLTD